VLYVCTSGDSKIWKIVISTGTVSEIGDLSGIYTPQDIVAIGEYLYVTNVNGTDPSLPTMNIAKINLSNIAGSFFSWVNSDTLALSYPIGLAEHCGSLYVCNRDTSAVAKINLLNPTGDLSDEFFISNKVYREYENPRRMVISGEFAYISNYGSSIISKVSLDCPHGDDTVRKWADECQGVNKPTDLVV